MPHTITDERPEKEQVLNEFQKESAHDKGWSLLSEQRYLLLQIRIMKSRLNVINHELDMLRNN